MKIATAWTVELIDAEIEQPTPGTFVLGLTLGGSLVRTVWDDRSSQDFLAWCHYPKIPASVKERMSRRMGA